MVRIAGRWPIVVLLAALAVGVGYGVSKPKPFILNNVLLATPQQLPTFELQSTKTKTFSQQALLGHWSLLFSGYTDCPDICPVTLSMLARWQQDRGDAEPTAHLLFVTVDPQRDQVDELQTYLQYFNAEITGLTGSADQLDGLLLALGFYPVTTSDDAVPAPSSAGRLLNHSGAIAVINPLGQLHAILRAPFGEDSLRQQLRQVLSSAVFAEH